MIHDLFQYLYSLENVGGVSGSIAVLITVTLCVGYIRNPAAEVNKVGDALIFALTTIIGFYFGTATGMKEPPSSQSSPAAIVSPTAPK